MAESSARLEELHEGLDEEPLLAFTIPLEEIIRGEDSTFRTQNRSENDLERQSIIQRTRGNVHSRVDLLELTHGSYEKDGDEATLLIFRVCFDPQKQSSRVRRARVKIEFAASFEADEPPVVDAIAPEETWAILPTTDQESTTRGGELTLGASTLVELGGKARLERTKNQDISGATTVCGSINLGTGKNMGEPTVASWNVLENKRRNTGVPDSLRLAIRLRRATAGPFKATVTLEADCDFLTGLQHRWTRFPIDDPILFNPRNTNGKARKGRKFGVDGLGEISLDSLCEVRMSVQAPFTV